MESQSGPRPGKLSSSSGLPRGRPPKHGHPQQEVSRTAPVPENNNNSNNKYGPVCGEAAEGKRKGRPKAEVQELRSIPAHMIAQWKEEFKRRSRVKCPSSGCWLEFPSIYGVKYHYQRCQGATLAEKLSHGCPYCEAVFATKVRLQKHKLWNHPDRVGTEPKEQHPRVGTEPKEQQQHPKLHKTTNVKANAKKRPMENSPPSPVFFKVKKTHEVSTPSQNGELARSDRRQQHSHSHSQPPQQQQQQQQPSSLQQSHHHHQPPVQSPSHTSHSHQSTSSDAGGSESEGGSLPPPFHDEEDPERMRHRRKQKTPKKFTGEQPSISGTFGLKGMSKVEEKLKAGRVKRPEGGSGHGEDTQRRSTAAGQASSRKDPPPAAPHSSGPASDAQWQHAISERGEVVCPTCSMVTRKTVQGLKKHMEICQKLQDALKCQQCHKQFRSKAGLNYHTMAEHSSKPSGSDGQTGDEQEERERLRRVLKQMGRIKCPSEGCSAQFTSLMGYQYHQKRCGRELSEDDKPVFLCQHCGKTYRSKAGKDYHVRTEHPPTTPNAKDSYHARTEHPAAPNAKDYHARTEHPAATPNAKDYHARTTEHPSPNAKEYHARTTDHPVPNAKDYHARTEHHPVPNAFANSKDATAATTTTDTNNNTGKERVICEESPSPGGIRKEADSRKEWPERPTTTPTTPTATATCCWPKEKERQDTAREKERVEQQRDRLKTGEQQQSLTSSGSSVGLEDLDRTPSGRVRRRSAQVAVFHLQEIAEDELAKDWGTKRRIKDDLVPDSKRLNYTRPGLPNFSPELLETWKNEVKEKGFICCTNSNCEAVYSSVSGLKAHLANCSQGGGELGKYTCLICQKEFSSESGVKYHISKTHSQNWFRAAAPTHTVSSSSKSKAPAESDGGSGGGGGIRAEVRNGATTTTTGKKRGRKPKERPLAADPLSAPALAPAKTPGGTAQNSTPPPSTTSSSSASSPLHTLSTTQAPHHHHPCPHQNPISPTDSSPVLNRQPGPHVVPRRGKPKRAALLPPPE